MPPFLPVQAVNRSQRVRIGGQLLKVGVTSYVDLQQLANPVAPTEKSKSEVYTKAALEKGKYYNYVITAVDAFGGETFPSVELSLKAGAGAEGANEYNTLTLGWTEVPGASGYNIYRSAKGGAAATTNSGKYTLLASITKGSTVEYTDITTTNTGTQTPPGANNTFVEGKYAASTRRELQQHSAVGAYIIVGPPTSSNLDWVPSFAEETGAWAITFASAEIKTAKAKELRQRSTGFAQKTECAASSATSIESTAGNEKYTIIVYNPLTNKTEYIKGADEAEGTANIDLVAEKVPAYQQIIGAALTKGTTKTVTSATSSLEVPPVLPPTSVLGKPLTFI